MHNPVVTSLFCVCLKYTCAESVYPVYAVSYLDSQDLGEIMAVGGAWRAWSASLLWGSEAEPPVGSRGQSPWSVGHGGLLYS